MPRVDVDVAYSTIWLHSRKSRTQALSNVLWTFRYGLRDQVVFPGERLCDGSQLMYFVCCSLSCQTVFRLVSDWLNSLSVIFGRDMNAKVFVLSEFFPATSEVTVLLLSNQELLQHGIHTFGSFWKIAIQQVVHVRRHHSNDSWFFVSKREQRRQNLVQWKFELFARVLQSKPQSSSCIFCTVDGNTWGQNLSACYSFFWDTFRWNTVQQDSINFLPLKASVREIAWVNGDVGLCAPAANDIVRIHIASWRICAESFCRLEICTANQWTLVLFRNRNIIGISSLIRVFVGINTFHRIDLATCFSELSHFFIRQNNTCIKLHPLVPFDASRLCESGLQSGRAEWCVRSWVSHSARPTPASGCAWAFAATPFHGWRGRWMYGEWTRRWGQNTWKRQGTFNNDIKERDGSETLKMTRTLFT